MTTDTLDGAPRQASASPRTLWQWILVYPTLAISLFGSIPTVSGLYQSHLFNVPFDGVSAAKRQNQLWETNIDCPHNAKAETVTTARNTKVSVTVCPSGDVLVVVQQPDSHETISRWIDVKALLQPSAGLTTGLLLGEALAGEDIIVVAQADSILCQRWLATGRLLRRIKDAQGQCFDEVVNTYTGVLESRVQAQCSDRC